MVPEPRAIEFRTGDGVRLHAIEWTRKKIAPKGPPVVLLHGGGANARWWDATARVLADTNPVYALDFRGHGDSDFPADHYVGAFSHDLDALLDHLNEHEVVLVGHSLGAAVALDHASRRCETRGLVLVDIARGSGSGTRRRARLALSLRRNYRTREEAIERFRFLPESSHASEEIRLDVAKHSVKRDPDGRFGYKFDPAWFGLPSKPRPDLTKIVCPTLVVRGAESALLTTAAASEFAAQIEHAEVVEIQRAGHHVLVDQPESLSRTIGEFLKKLG